MSEEAWVETLKKRFPFSLGLGIGDDAAVLRPQSGSRHLVVTTDLLVEGVHFRKNDLTPQELARKSLAVNLSDLAAMAARPLFYTLGLALPPDYMGDRLSLFYDGLEAGNRRWDVQLAGGDFSASTILTISITAVGETERPLLRSGAQVGDLIGVCGHLGWSRLGLQEILAGSDLRHSRFVAAHIAVEPLLQQGLRLGQWATAMMDVSDGLLKDLRRMCAASGLGAELDVSALEMDVSFRDTCLKYGLSPLQTMLSGGEDYALLFTASPGDMAVIKGLGLEPGIVVLGQMVPGSGEVRVFDQGVAVAFSEDGYDHFDGRGHGD